jgi:hypothetical protein
MASRPRRRAVRGEDLRTALAARLPGRIRDLLADYEAFSTAAAVSGAEGDGEKALDAKGYAAHHAACKAALQHTDMLIKLLRWAEGGEPEAPAAGPDPVDRLLARARTSWRVACRR